MAAAENRALRASLGLKLGVALLVLSIAMLAFLLLWVGPQTTRAFVSRCDTLVAQTTALMKSLSTEHTQGTRDVLIDVIDHLTEARTRTLADEPLSIYGGDVERIRTAIKEQDQERGARIQGNAHVLAREAQRRAEARIDAHLEGIAGEQHAQNALFASDLRRSFLIMCGAALTALVLVLGLGTWWSVVRPVVTLRAATRRVAAGDLGVSVNWRSSDEIGALAHGFSSMVGQLRESRKELERLNRDLEGQVQKKTQQLVQAEKMASIGTLAGGIAHEFNNLVGGIRGCVQELVEEGGDPGHKETLGVILRATDRATAIVQQLLRFAKRTSIRPEPIDLALVLEDALRLTAPEARRRGVEVRRQLEPRLRLVADPDGLHQVLVNLMTNALQAMPSGGTLTLSAARENDAVVLRVTDTGIGIAPADQKRIFEPFFTSKDRERDPLARGSGLGLSVSFGIVEAHGGRLEFESALGRGTTFVVRLPGGEPPGPVPPV